MKSSAFLFSTVIISLSSLQFCHSHAFGMLSPYSSLYKVLTHSLHRRRYFTTKDFIHQKQDKYYTVLRSSNDGANDEETGHSKRSVGIVGAGAIAYATATILSTRGHDPMLWSPSGRALSTLTSSGAIEYEFKPRIASNAKQLIESNDIIILALPANGHVLVMDAIAPFIQTRQIVIISSHSSLGAVYLTQLLSKRDVSVPIVAWGTTIATARKTSSTSVQLCTIRTLVDMCTVPSTQTNLGYEVCKDLFGQRFKLRDGLLAISLSNLNAQNHLGIALGNMSRMERGEKWSQGLNLTPNIGRLLEALDRERLEIATVLGLQVRTIYEHFQLSFHVPVASVSEMNQAMVLKGNDVNGPDTADSRYVTEDVPYGLTLIVALGRLVGRPAILHEAGIQIISAMYGKDFSSENGLLNALCLEDFSIEDIQKASYTGLLRTECNKVEM